MAYADYRCTDCDAVDTREVTSERFFASCCQGTDAHGDSVMSELVRVWTPVSIGAVSGAGGSPARTGS